MNNRVHYFLPTGRYLNTFICVACLDKYPIILALLSKWLAGKIFDCLIAKYREGHFLALTVNGYLVGAGNNFYG